MEVEWKGFEIHPETPVEGTSRSSIPPERLKVANEHIAQMAVDAGVEMSRPELRANSHLALVADAFARDHGKSEPFRTRIFEAYWQRHLNIGQRDIVLEVARDCGLDVTELEAAVDDQRYESELASVYDECSRYGINGVPTFLIGRYLIVGAQPYEVLERALKQAEEEAIKSAT